MSEADKRLREALERIAEQQPQTIAMFRRHDIVFDGPLGNDPKNWQHVAFSVYTDLCEVATIARTVLDEVAPPPEFKCAACRDTGVLDENGNPSVWGRSDSHECPFCSEDTAADSVSPSVSSPEGTR